MTQNSDPRVRRTQTLIRDAFIELVIERGFDRVTVQALTERANINRATFYRHYSDLHDLVARLTDILFVDVLAQFGEEVGGDAMPGWTILFEHVAQYAPFYLAVMGKRGIPGFRERVQESVERELNGRLPAWGFDEANLKMPLSLPIRYLAAAQVGFIQWWLENGMPFPPEEAARYLIALHTQGGIWALGLVAE